MHEFRGKVRSFARRVIGQELTEGMLQGYEEVGHDIEDCSPNRSVRVFIVLA